MSTQAPTESTVHGHEIIHLINAANPPFSRASLTALVKSRFGVEARFHTCHDSGLTLDGLLAFLIARGKIVEQNGLLIAQMSRVCNDGQH